DAVAPEEVEMVRLEGDVLGEISVPVEAQLEPALGLEEGPVDLVDGRPILAVVAAGLDDRLVGIGFGRILFAALAALVARVLGLLALGLGTSRRDEGRRDGKEERGERADCQ